MKKIDPLNERRIFGGKIVVFGGDFRQIPPVVKRGCREDTVASCLKRSPIWQQIESIKLTVNMRLLCNSCQSDIDEQAKFADWLLSVGDGTITGTSSDYGIHTNIILPPQVLLGPHAKIQDLIVKIYSELPTKKFKLLLTIQKVFLYQLFGGRMIMCSKNDEVHQINTLITESIPGTTWQLHSIDSIVTDSGPCETLHDMITPEFLHGLDSSSIRTPSYTESRMFSYCTTKLTKRRSLQWNTTHHHTSVSLQHNRNHYQWPIYWKHPSHTTYT